MTRHIRSVVLAEYKRWWSESYSSIQPATLIESGEELGYGNTDNVGDDETPASAGDVQIL